MLPPPSAPQTGAQTGYVAPLYIYVCMQLILTICSIYIYIDLGVNYFWRIVTRDASTASGAADGCTDGYVTPPYESVAVTKIRVNP